MYKVTASAGATLLASESATATVLGTIPADTIVEALSGSSASWIKVNYGGNTGYVAIADLTLVS